MKANINISIVKKCGTWYKRTAYSTSGRKKCEANRKILIFGISYTEDGRMDEWTIKEQLNIKMNIFMLGSVHNFST